MLVAGSGAPTPAAAEVGGDLALLSNDMFRGRSISSGRPVARAGLAYDDLGGAYAGVSATGVLERDGGAQLLAVQQYAGLARRLKPELTLDIGAVNTNYTHYWTGARASGYTELYAGLIGRRLSARFNLSPNYLRHGVTTGYGAADAVLLSRGPWEVSAHGGIFVWLAGGRPPGASLTHYDWRIGAARRLGRFRIEAAWAAGGPQREYYAGSRRRRGNAVVGLAVAL